jgi:uncharacterized membrane protein
MLSKILNKNKFFIILVILGCIFRWSGISNGYWYDEWSSFYYSNPILTVEQIFNAVIAEEGAQPLYFIIASKWNYLFSYSPESLRYFSLFLGTTSIILFIILLKEFSKNNNFLYLATFLFISNYFLIQFSQESRFYSLSIFFSILNLIFFFRFLKKNKYIYYYIFFSILSLLTNIFSILLIFSQIFFLIIKKKKIYSLSSIISIFFWYIIDYKYISSIFEKSLKVFNISDTINLHFLVGYYFNIYFGGVFLGGLILIFSLFYLKNIKKIINDNILFCIISIFITYFAPVIYSIIKNPILRPRYIIFIVPIIIIYFCYIIFKIEEKFIKKIFISVVIISSLINIFHFKPIIFKPDSYSAIKVIANSNNKFLLIKPDSNYFYNYFTNLSFAKKEEIIFINKNQILDKNFFWSICLNNPRFATNNRTDDKNCLYNPYYNSHKILEIKKVPDYILILYKKN